MGQPAFQSNQALCGRDARALALEDRDSREPRVLQAHPLVQNDEPMRRIADLVEKGGHLQHSAWFLCVLQSFFWQVLFTYNPSLKSSSVPGRTENTGLSGRGSTPARLTCLRLNGLSVQKLWRDWNVVLKHSANFFHHKKQITKIYRFVV